MNKITASVAGISFALKDNPALKIVKKVKYCILGDVKCNYGDDSLYHNKHYK